METNTSIIVKNYHKRNSQDSPQSSIIDFFAFCGNIQNFAINEEADGTFTAIITFESAAAAQVALLLNTAEIGLEGEKISVSILRDAEKPEIIYTTVPPSETPKPPVAGTHTDIITNLLEKGYKLKSDVLDLAKVCDSKVREAIHTAGSTVATTTTVAYQVTGEKLHQIQETVGHLPTVEAIKHVGEVTSTSLQQAGAAVVNTG